MNIKIYIILFIFVFSLHCYAQNKIQLEFGIGPNYTSAYLNHDIPPFGLIEIKNDYGIDTRTTISIPIRKNFTIFGMLNYDFSKSKIKFARLKFNDDVRDSSTWHIDSKLSDYNLGFSIGIKKKLIEKLSISALLTYSKILNRKFINHIITNQGRFDVELEKIRNIPIFDDFSSSVELSYNFLDNFNIVTGYEYSFTKTDYFPTKKYSEVFQYYGNRYKYYLLISYRL